MSVLKIPVWPKTEGDIPMTFLHGEPGWYVWLQHKPGLELSRLERDMMLLYNNGDLRDFPSAMNPEPGIYVCFLAENKIIRGLILNKHKNVAPGEGALLILDVDSGNVHTVPYTEIKVLPTFACEAPARSVRCDLGLDCKERFEWPSQIDEMLKRALSDAELLVAFESERPGSIPTVSVKARLWNPFAGSGIDFRDWLINFFGPHLEISSMDGHLPEPICNSKAAVSRYEPERPKSGEPMCVSPINMRPNMWNPYAEPFLSASMFPQVAPPPGFSPLNPFLFNQGFVYSPLPWTLMMPNQADNFSTSEICASQFPTGLRVDNIVQEKLPRSGVELMPQINVKNLPETVEAEATPEPIARSTTPVLTVESLLNGSPTVGRKPVKKENLAALESSSAAQEPMVLQPLLRRQIPAAEPKEHKVRARPGRSDNHLGAVLKMPKKHEHISLKDVERNWTVGTVVHVIMSHVISPEVFAANVVDANARNFDRLQKEMLDYDGSLPLSVTSKETACDVIGRFCVCYDIEESFWFRAEVVDWRFEDAKEPIRVWSVDFGGFHDVALPWVRALDGELCTTVPIQATLFSMHNVRPRQDISVTHWPAEHCVEICKLLRVGVQFWLRLEKPYNEGSWPVSVFKFSNCLPPSFNTMLVDKGLAFYCNSMTAPNQPKLDVIPTSTEWDPMRDDYERGGRNVNCDDEDACFAVSGFKPNDEKNVCRFFAEKGKCPKGLNCRQRHVTLREGGWTQEKEEVYTSAFNDLELPDEGSVFNMRVTRIINVHHFVGVKIPNTVSSSEEHYQMLFSQLNSRESVQSFQFCKTAPAFGQLVIAKDKKNDHWFRARVLDVSHDVEDRFEVLNVDTGNIYGVHLNDLRDIDPAYLHLPFQAIECFLADMHPSKKGKEFLAEGCAFVTEKVKNQRIQVYVVKRTIENALEVKVLLGCADVGRGGEDLATFLYRGGYIQRGAKRIASSDVVRFMPG